MIGVPRIKVDGTGAVSLDGQEFGLRSRYLESKRPELGRNVIVMTANLPVAAEAAKASPVAAVLPKPFDIRELIDEIRVQSAA